MDNLKERFDQFGRDPSSKVWDKIDKELDQDEEKVIPWWLYAAAGVALLLGLGYYSYKYSANEYPNNIVEKTLPVIDEDGSDVKTNKNIVPNNQRLKAPEKTDKSDIELKSTEGVNDKHQQNDRKIANNTSSDSNPGKEIDENRAAIHYDDKNESISINVTPKTNAGSKIEKEDMIQNENNDLAEKKETEIEGDIDNIDSDVELLDPILSFADIDLSENESTRDIRYMDIKLIEGLDNTLKVSPIPNEFDLPEITSSRWAFAGNFKQGFIDNKSIGVSRLASVSESFTLTNLDYRVESHYINDKPIWFELQALKKIGANNHLIFSAEYGQQTSSIDVEGQTIFENDNKNVSLGLGIGHELLKRGRISIGLNGILRVGNEINDWKKLDATDIAEPSPTIFNSPSADILDQAIINQPISKTNLMTNGEVSFALNYQLNEKFGIQLSPFVRQYLSQKYPSSDNFGEAFQWGLGGGVTF